MVNGNQLFSILSHDDSIEQIAPKLRNIVIFVTKNKKNKMKYFRLLLLLLLSKCISAQNTDNFVKDNYLKMDTTISMRDGIKLYTVIYYPKDKTEKYPFLIQRTPYSSGPYGKNNYAKNYEIE